MLLLKFCTGAHLQVINIEHVNWRYNLLLVHECMSKLNMCDLTLIPLALLCIESKRKHVIGDHTVVLSG